MSKQITNRELSEIVTRLLTEPKTIEAQLDSPERYGAFMRSVAGAICYACGGEVSDVPPDNAYGRWLIGIRPNDSLPDDGGIWKNYDPEADWPGVPDGGFRPANRSALLDAINKTNWGLLRQQKLALLKLTGETGLIYFLDAIQDAVVEDGLFPKEVVFPEEEVIFPEEEVGFPEGGDPAAAGESQPHNIAEINADLESALDECVLQIEQMQGMFDDSDGRIQAALDDARDALSAARVAGRNQFDSMKG